MAADDPRPLVVHIVHRFAVGGLENGVVNLVNRLPPERWRHAVLALTSVDAGFAARIQRPDVECVALHKPPGQGLWLWPRVAAQLRVWRPAIVHTRNLAALEMMPAAWWAGVRGRVHGEHGRDAEDPDGRSRKHRLMRRAFRPFVQRYVALSRDLAAYLHSAVGVPRQRIAQIYNGVDVERFMPAALGRAAARAALPGCPFTDPGLWLVGTVGRMQTVKAQPLLAAAFVQLLRDQPDLRTRLRLVLVGDGPLRAECEALLQQAGARELAWFAGERADVPDLMRALDCFVLPSLAEGISNTVLEAMATALPVVATAVGGNADLVEHGVSGRIVPPGDVAALAGAIAGYAQDPGAAAAAGAAGRRRVQQRFSLGAMVDAYAAVYDEVLQASRRGTRRAAR